MKTQKVNIYLDDEMQKVSKKLRKKYHVSLSTCVQIIADNMFQIWRKLADDPIIIQDAKKTSIKPKLVMGQLFDNIPKAKGYVLSECLYIYCHDLIYSYYDKEAGSEIKQKIHNQLNNTRESYYNYNEQLRNNVRMAKDPSFQKYWEKISKKTANETSRT